MTDYLAAFITGLTTGGLSCLAVQGGLLTASFASQVEKSVETSVAANASRKNKRGSQSQNGLINNGRSATAIVVFLIAKVAAYSVLGLLLGWLGSAFQLTPVTRGWFQLGIGLFMLGNALRMFNIHPVFRYFSFEPPSVITRFIRRKAKTGGSDLLTPAFLGLLTVLIPCGVTQAMMALALATGDPIQGAVLMFAFTLGTSPVFFVLAYLFTRLGSRLERGFVMVTAILILALGLISVNSGLNLMGSPISVSNLFNAKTTQQANLMPGANNSVVRINAENAGYSPNVVYAKAGVPVRLELITDNTQSCTRAFTIPVLNVAEILPKTGTKVVEIPAQKAGKISFSCSMGMYTGVIVFQ